MDFISKKSLESWLASVAETKKLYAPVYTDGVLLYQQPNEIEDIVWDFSRPVQSAKEIIFPQSEKMLTIEKNGQNIQIIENLNNDISVIFGVRSCDARGCLVLDKLLVEAEPVDHYYKTRRENTALVGLACEEMGDTCFCTSVGGGPDNSEGLDVMLHRHQDGYLVEIVSSAGEELFNGIEFDRQDIAFNERRFEPEFVLPSQDLLKSSFDSEIWRSESERCLSCRICAYVCPTCRCFDVRDEPGASNNGTEIVERIRGWDSCSGEAYRRIAGGHNPREAKADRLRNRIYCKLHYTQEQSGMMACTGCGRCIDSCPVNIDITEIIGLILEGEPG
ncbi:MAG: 4Fe-4S dicluster domain-containing protein [Chloroflexota bacterium]